MIYFYLKSKLNLSIPRCLCCTAQFGVVFSFLIVLIKRPFPIISERLLKEVQVATIVRQSDGLYRISGTYISIY